MPSGFGDLAEQVFGFVSGDGAAVANGARGEIGVAHHGVHEIVSHAYGVVGVLEEDGRVGFGIWRRPVVAGCNQSVGLGLFFGLAFDEVDDIGMVNVEDDHLGGTAGLATALDDAGEGVETFHEAEWAAGSAASAQTFGRGTQGREIGAGSGSPLEEHAFGFGQSEDGVE